MPKRDPVSAGAWHLKNCTGKDGRRPLFEAELGNKQFTVIYRDKVTLSLALCRWHSRAFILPAYRLQCLLFKMIMQEKTGFLWFALPSHLSGACALQGEQPPRLLIWMANKLGTKTRGLHLNLFECRWLSGWQATQSRVEGHLSETLTQ